MRNHNWVIISTACVLLMVVSCKVIEYPLNKAYNYKTTIIIQGNYSNEEKNILLQNLEKQIDDSLVTSKVRYKKKSWLLNGKKIKYHEIDSFAMKRTAEYFKAAYVANGYFRGGATRYKIDTPNAAMPYRVTTTFIAYPYQNHTINKINYDIKDTALLQLTQSIINGTVLHAKDYYSQSRLDEERKRLATYYANNGYLKFSIDDIKIIADTINTALLQFTDDPFEQQALYERAATFNEQPTTNITIAFKDSIPSSRLKKYYIGNVYFNYDNIDEYYTPTIQKPIPNTNVVLQYDEYNYKQKLFAKNNFLVKGILYNQYLVTKTVERFNALGPWQQIIVTPMDSTMRGDTIDFKFTMLPFKKLNRESRLEGSLNTNPDNVAFSQNLFGITGSMLLKNRNFAHSAIQANIIGNTSVEFFQGRVINTLQAGLTLSLTIPKPTKNHFINFNINNTKRFEQFELADVGLANGYQWKSKKIPEPTLLKRNTNWQKSKSRWSQQAIFPNVENKILTVLKGLREAINSNPLLALVYNDGLIISGKYLANQSIQYNHALNNKWATIVNNRMALELSNPFIAKGLNRTLDSNLFSFVKLELEKNITINRKKHAFAARALIGIGSPFNRGLRQNKHLPFFRQFIGGGPSSMRAWNVRNISSYSTRVNKSEQTDFFGDVQVEVNGEYRFNMIKLAGIPVKGALFLDAGNIWNWTPLDPAAVPTGLSTVNKIMNDIGIASGFGVRIDFDYFILRFDIANKLKQPLDVNGVGGFNWKSYTSLKGFKFQLGINYPF